MNCLRITFLLCALAVLSVGNMIADRLLPMDVIERHQNGLENILNRQGIHPVPEDPLDLLNHALKRYRGSIELHVPVPPNEPEVLIKIVPKGLIVQRPRGMDCNEFYEDAVRRATFMPLLEKLQSKQISFLQTAHEHWDRGSLLRVHARDTPKYYKRYCSLPEQLQHRRLFDVTHPRETLPYIGGMLKALRGFCSGDGITYL